MKQEMQFVQHLDELRKRIIITLGVFIAALCGAFIFAESIYGWLSRDLGQPLTVLGPADLLWVYLMISGVFAIAITIPVAGVQIWQFVKPGLKPKEQRATLSFIPSLAVLFLLGICFGYFVVFPMVLQFLMSLANEEAVVMYTADKYFRFMVNLTVPMGLLFEMPAVVMFLTKLGVLNPLRLAKARKISYFVLIAISISITPPDFVSDVLVIVPLLILYEISITLSKMVYKKQLTSAEDRHSNAA